LLLFNLLFFFFGTYLPENRDHEHLNGEIRKSEQKKQPITHILSFHQEKVLKQRNKDHLEKQKYV